MGKCISCHCQIGGTFIYLLYIIGLVGRIEAIKLKCGSNLIFAFSPIFWSYLVTDTMAKIGTTFFFGSCMSSSHSEKTCFTLTYQNTSSKNNKFSSKRSIRFLSAIISNLAFMFQIFILLYNPYLEFLFTIVISYLLSLIMMKNKVYLCQIICMLIICTLSILREYFDGFYFGQYFYILILGSIFMSSLSDSLTSVICFYEGNLIRDWLFLQSIVQWFMCIIYIILVPSSFLKLYSFIFISDLRGLISSVGFLVFSMIYYVCNGLILKQNPNPAFKVIPNTFGILFYYVFDILNYLEYKTNKNKIIFTGFVLVVFFIISLFFNGVIQFKCCEYKNVEISKEIGLIEKDVEGKGNQNEY